MLCKKCGKVLETEDTICPRCGEPGGNKEPIANKGILAKLMENFGGMELLSEENHSRLNKALAMLENINSKDRDLFLIANMKYIPQRLYAIVGSTSSEREKIISECLRDLLNLDIAETTCRRILNELTQCILGETIIKENTADIEKGKKEEPISAKKDDSLALNKEPDQKPIDDQDIRHWKEDKFFKNVYSSEEFKNADLESKAEMRRVAKEEAKMIKALRRDAGLGGGCYITTAICEASGKPDDCYELTMMRKFRDEWLAKQPDGYYLINDYYETAPKIVAAIDSLRERSSIYDYLNCNFLKKCVDFAGRNLMADCKKYYMDMVQYCHKFLNE